jgi:2,4-dienoyl-CoA reductase-like NADH-dependent reductase (Old Yellow Enzyme family)
MTDVRSPFTLPCGGVLANRLVKAAMTEGIADAKCEANARHVRLYGRWARSGVGLQITGNVQIDRRHLERPGNVVLDGAPSSDHRQALGRWAKSVTETGAHIWMQINHAGRQTPKLINPTPDAPSAVALKLPGGNFGQPKAMTAETILSVIGRFAAAAQTARETGFTGVQIHGAHGYLASQFLSPISNRRTDEWGGPLANRARFLLECVKAVRKAVGADFPVAVKLNSADFQKGGFGHEDAIETVQMLNEVGIDLLEVSGGTYEQPRMIGLDGVLEPVHDASQRPSTRAREAYFLNYADSIAKAAKMPVMVTGGLRTSAGMADALADGRIAFLGIARPMCGDPESPRALLDGRAASLPNYEKSLRLGPGWLGPNSPLTMLKAINAFGAQAWYYEQIRRLGDGLEPDLKLGVWRAFRGNQAKEAALAKAMAAAA